VSHSSDLLEIIKAGIDSARPAALFPALFKQPDDPLLAWMNSQHRFLLCLGKASIDSARTILNRIRCDDSFVLSPYEDPEHSIPVHLGSHPIPNEQSFESTRALLTWLKEKPSDGALLVVLSGGTSALCVMPFPSVGLQDKMRMNDMLIRSGANIQEINTVRKHLSLVKGGQLSGFASQMKTCVVVISDVIGDDFATIGSGPFYPDPTTFLDAKNVLTRYGLWNDAPVGVRETIENGISGLIWDTPKQGHIPHRIIASNEIARQAAASKAQSLGYEIQMPEGSLQGDVENAAKQIFATMQQLRPKSALVWGGEITIQLKGNGTGGRNQHLALLLTEKIGNLRASFAAAGTDGIDGNSRAAGAWTDDGTFERASGTESLRKAAENFDSYHYFENIGQNIITGPTGTNVMDLYVALI
jgi:glycerate 2-kinase